MRNHYFLLLLAILSITGCFNRTGLLAPKVITVIDLDDKSALVKETLALKVIYNCEWYSSKQELMANFIPWINDLIEGRNSTLYLIDTKNSRLVELAQDGKIIRSIGGPGSGPGEFINPYGTLCRSNKYIYVPDFDGIRLQIFDLDGKYIRAINNTNIFKGLFYVSPSDKILFAPPKHAFPQIPYMVVVHDSLGKELKKIGLIKDRYNFLFENNIRKSYSIIANEETGEIWCVFVFFPYIWKFDYAGNFLEEIQLKSRSLSDLFNKRAEMQKKSSGPKGRDVGVLLLNSPSLNGNNLIINVASHGNIVISSEGDHSKLIKIYELTELPEDLLKRALPSMYKLRFINGRPFAFEKLGIIAKH